MPKGPSVHIKSCPHCGKHYQYAHGGCITQLAAHDQYSDGYETAPQLYMPVDALRCVYPECNRVFMTCYMPSVELLSPEESLGKNHLKELPGITTGELSYNDVKEALQYETGKVDEFFFRQQLLYQHHHPHRNKEIKGVSENFRAEYEENLQQLEALFTEPAPKDTSYNLFKAELLRYRGKFKEAMRYVEVTEAYKHPKIDFYRPLRLQMRAAIERQYTFVFKVMPISIINR